jgi:hypothetical protein
VRPEDIVCNCCENTLLGRGVLLVPVVPDDAGGENYGDPMFLHQTCFLEVFDSFFKQELTTHFEMYVGTVFDIWAGLFTDDDTEAGIPDGH